MDIDKIINIVRSLREQAVMGAPTNAVGTGQTAGTKEAGDDPPVDLRKKRSWSIFWKDAARRDRKKKK